MSKKIATINIGKGNQQVLYSKVKDRLKEFREANPRASIKSTYKIEGDRIVFETIIIRDKADEFSADANGIASGKNDDAQKNWEKIETISLGRALGKMGYANDGEIASSEEMEEFEDFQKEKKMNQITDAIEILEQCKTIEELQRAFKSLDRIGAIPEVFDAKNRIKKTLE